MIPTAYKYTGFKRDRVSEMMPLDSVFKNITPLYAIPKGYKLVPIEPTEEMKNSMPEIFSEEELDDVYKAIIEAAPKIEDINDN